MLMQQIEAIPATWPAVPSGLSTAAAALAPAMVWGRIEAHTTVRYTARAVTWVVEGPGEWVPPLLPASISTFEIWVNPAWEAFDPDASPLGGYQLEGEGPYRFTGTVGGGAVPAPVGEAYRRLAEYLAGSDDAPAGATDFSSNIGGDLTESFSRASTWLARAMQNSGAADLLRPYRRAG